MEEQQHEMPESLEYLSEHIIINNPLEQYYYPLKLKQDDLLSQFLMFKNDILIQQQQRQQQQQSNAKVKSTSKSKSNKTPSPPRNKNNLDVASRLIEKQKIKEAKLEKLRQEKLNKIEAERKANTPVMSQKSRQIMKHRVHTPTTLYDRHNAMKEVHVKKKQRLKEIIDQEKMKEMKNSPSINQASKKMAKRGVDKMMEWEKKRQAKLEKLKQEKIEREKSHVILPKASKKSEKILLKKKRQLKKQKEEREKLMRQQEKTQQMQVVIEEEENDYDNIIESFHTTNNTNNHKLSPTSAAAKRLFEQAKMQQRRKEELANEIQFSHSPKLISRSKNYKKNNNNDGRNKIDVSDRLYRLAKKREVQAHHKQFMKEQLEVIDKESGRELFKPKINKRSKKIMQNKASYDWRDELPVEDRLYTTGIKYNKKKENERRKHAQMVKAKMENKHISLNSEILADRRAKKRNDNCNKKKSNIGFQRPIGTVKQSTLNSIVRPTFQPNVDDVGKKDNNMKKKNIQKKAPPSSPSVKAKPLISKQEKETYIKYQKNQAKMVQTAKRKKESAKIHNLVKNRIFSKNMDKSSIGKNYNNSINNNNRNERRVSSGQRKKLKKKTNSHIIDDNDVIQSKLRNKLFGSSVYTTSKNGDENPEKKIILTADEAAMSYVDRLNLINKKNNIPYVNNMEVPNYYYEEEKDEEDDDNNIINPYFNSSDKSTGSTERAMHTNLPLSRSNANTNDEDDPDDWKEYVSSAGYVYYYNEKRNITQWEKPM